MGELSALLDDDSDGQRLAEFLLKKNGGSTRPRRVFAAYQPERFSIDVRTEKIKTPTGQKNASPKTISTTNNVMQRDVAKMQQLSDEAVPLQDKNIAVAVPILPASSPTLLPVTVPAPILPSPSERLSTRRSGGAKPSADRLRRFSLKRLSSLSVGRKLLQEFDSTVTDTNFLPPICSTPMMHSANTPADIQTPFDSQNLEDIPAKTVEKSGATSTAPSSTTADTHYNTERMLNSLRKHDAALHHMLEHDSDTTIKQVHEKENLYRPVAHTPPPPSPSQAQPQSPAPHKHSNRNSRPATPVSNQNSRPTTPVANRQSRPTTPLYNQRNRPTTPLNQRSRLTTPVSNHRSRSSTPVDANQLSRPSTPVSNKHSRSTTPVSSSRRRTYTVEKGSKPGQVLLTPAKSPLACEQQQQQPTSTVADGKLELPSSPVEEAIYRLHTINLVTPDSPISAPPIPVEPLLASPKLLRVMQRYAACKSPKPATALKASSIKKSRIPLMTPAAKLKCKTQAHVDVSNTQANKMNVTRTHVIIPETQEELDESNVEIPESQDLPTETQKLLETLQKNQTITPMIVIPIHQTFNHAPTQSHETTTAGKNITTKLPTVCPYYNETTTTPINIEADTTMHQLTSQNADDKATNSAKFRASPTAEIIATEDELRLSDILTDDEQDVPVFRSSRRRMSNNDRQLESSNAPLNLASQPQPQPQQTDSRSSSAARSRRLRKRSTTRRTQQQQQSKLSPLLSTETESEVGPPRAHPLITGRKSARLRRKIPLNAAPSSPINGERFAVEMKTHLARLNNHEILDLRKRNSLGKVFAISGRRKSLSRNTSSSAKQLIEQQLQLEEEIQLEILKRNLNDKGEDLEQHSPVSVSILLTEEEAARINELPNVETDQIYEQPNEEAELLHTIPPAPVDFRDITTRLSLAKSRLWQEQEHFDQSSLVDDKSCDQVKFVSNNVSKKSTRSQATKRRGRHNKKSVPEVLQKYLEVSKRTKTNRTYSNQSKRSLYSQDTEISNSENSSIEQAKSPPKAPAATSPRIEQQQPETTFTLSASKRLSNHPLPPPDSFADDLEHATAAESMAVSTVAGSSSANDMDNEVFKKPGLPAPKKVPKTKKTTRGRVQKKTADDTQTRMESTTPQKHNNDDDVLQSNTAEPHDESSSVRRSKRGPKPLQNYWSFRSTDPTPLYDVAILERRREESRKLRETRLYNSKTSIAGENSTMSTASSTVKSNINSTKKRGRQKKSNNFLGDTDSSSLSSSSVSSTAPRQKRLTMIQETESQSVGHTEQAPQDENLGDNMFNRLDEVDISISQTHKVSRTPQRNNGGTSLKKNDDVEKAAKKKATKKATKAKKPTESKKSTTKATASSAKKKKNEEALITPEPEEENLMDFVAASEPAQQLVIHSSTAAHINDIFDKLKSGMSADTTHPTNPSNLTKCLSSTSKKLCRVRLSRVRASDVSKSTRSNSSKNSKVNLASSQAINEEELGSNAPAWLRDISHVGSKILKETDEEKEMFEQMLCSQPGNLVLTDVDGLDYAYYENNKDIPFGYMRFQPKQAKRTKRARYYNLRFFVLSGKFKICTNKDIAHCSEGSVVTILKGSSYSITNLTDKLAILMVFRKQEN